MSAARCRCAIADAMSPRLPWTAAMPRTTSNASCGSGEVASTLAASSSARSNRPHHANGSMSCACTLLRSPHVGGASASADSKRSIAALGATDTTSSAARTSQPTASRSPVVAPREYCQATCCTGAPARASACPAARCRSRRSAGSMSSYTASRTRS